MSETNDGINELSTKGYFGISEIKFKSRTHKNDNELSKYIWS